MGETSSLILFYTDIESLKSLVNTSFFFLTFHLKELDFVRLLMQFIIVVVNIVNCIILFTMFAFHLVGLLIGTT